MRFVFGILMFTATMLIVINPVLGIPTSDSSKAPCVFLRNVPAEVKRQVDEGLTCLAKKHPLSKERLSFVGKTVESLSSKGYAKDQENNRKRYADIRDVGLGAMLIVADLLTAKDKDLRHRATLALGVFTVGDKPAILSCPQAERLLIALLRRSLLDQSPDVRRQALGILHGVGVMHGPRPQIPDEVIRGLERTELDDPDPQLRRMARDYRIHLGLIPPDVEQEE